LNAPAISGTPETYREPCAREARLWPEPASKQLTKAVVGSSLWMCNVAGHLYEPRWSGVRSATQGRVDAKSAMHLFWDETHTLEDKRGEGRSEDSLSERVTRRAPTDSRTARAARYKP